MLLSPTVFDPFFDLLAQKNFARPANAELDWTPRDFQKLLENAADVVSVLAEDGTIRYESNSIEAVLGYKPEELVGKNAFEWVHPDDLMQLATDFNLVLSSEESGPICEFRFRHKDGSWRLLQAIGRNLLGDPAIGGVVVTLRDVTQLRQDEFQYRQTAEALIQSEDKYRSLVENVDGVFYQVEFRDGRGIPTWMSEGAAKITGYSPQELLETPDLWFQNVHPDDKPAFVAALDEFLKTGQSKTLHYRICHRDGAYRWIEDRATPRLGEAGTVCGTWGMARDITQEKAIEDAQHQSEARFKSAFEASSLGMALVALEGNWLQVNARLCEMLGYDESQLLQTTFQELTYPADLEADLSLVRRLLKGEIPSFQMEKRYLHKNDYLVWALLNVSLVRNGEGEPLYFISQIEDISERKRAEAALRESEATKTAILSAALDAIVSMDGEGNVTEWNTAAERIFGHTKEQAMGQSMAELIIAPHLRENHRDDLANFLQTGDALILDQRVELSALRRDGTEIKIELIVSEIHDGNNPQFAAFMRDITEIKRNEERLRLLESVAVNANDAILITQAEPINLPGPRILYANQAFLHNTGYTLEEIIGQTPRILQGPETNRATLDTIRSALEKWKPVVVELLNYRKDGSTFWIENSIVPIANESGWFTHWVSIQRDVTERKEIEIALRAAKVEAERANSAKSEFLSRMSHELRTPLNAILGFGQLLEIAELNQDDQQSTDQILKAGRHLLSLIDEVLEISRIESGNMALELEAVAAVQMARETLDLVAPLAAKRGIQLELQAPDGEALVRAEARRFKQVLLNLLSNAVKYNREKGRVVLSLEKHEEHLKIAVRDTGLGLAPDQIARLFVPFERVGAENTEIEGTGIGLALSQRLSEAMGGTLKVESEVGIGSTFCLELPLAHGEKPRLVEAIRDLETTPNLVARRVLYIEDNLSNLKLIERLVARRSEIELVSAANGKDGLEMAQLGDFDLILLDLNLPGLSGAEVLAQLRQNPETAAIPVVILSADATPHQIARLKEAGAQDYLTKPLDVREFWRTLDFYLKENG